MNIKSTEIELYSVKMIILFTEVCILTNSISKLWLLKKYTKSQSKTMLMYSTERR